MTQEHDAETVERVAAAMWRAETVESGTPESVTLRRTPQMFRDLGETNRTKWIKFARAALSAMPAREVTGWQPISTAPHGVEVMVVKAGTHPFTGKPYIPITAYYEPHIWTDHMDRICDDYDPTHWMPLPPSPEGV